MKILILISLLGFSQTVSAKLSLNLTQGFATHYTKFDQYNDSVFKDNLTSTNTLLTLNYNNFGLTGLADSQGQLSFALAYSKKFNNGFGYTLGTYIVRSDKIINVSPMLEMFPVVSVGSRSWSITPLAGLTYNKKLTNNVSLDILMTPAFTLWGLTFKVGN